MSYAADMTNATCAPKNGSQNVGSLLNSARVPCDSCLTRGANLEGIVMEKRTFKFSPQAAIWLSIALSGCGGGGASAPTPTPAATPAPTPAPTPTPGPFTGEGIYFTQTAPSSAIGAYSAYVTILDSGRYFSVNSDDHVGLDNGGLEHGTVSGDASTFSSANDKIFIFGQPDAPTLVGLSGTYGAQSFSTTMVLTLSGGGATYHNQGGPATYSSQDTTTLYDHPIALSDIAGSYTGNMYGKLSSGNNSKVAITTFSVDTSGNYNATAGACSLSGAMTQHGNTAVFDLSTTVSGSGCNYAGQMSGIVTPTHWVNGQKDLQFQLFTSDNTKALLLSVTKP
jgi:hypothetical protein